MTYVLVLLFAAVSCGKDGSNLNVETGGAALIKSNSACLTGYIHEDKSDFVSYGFYYSENKDSISTSSGSSNWDSATEMFSDTLSGLKYETTYWYVAYAKASGGHATRGAARSFTTGAFSFEAVDLGLSVKWANANVGSATDDLPGGHYAWGTDAEAAAATFGTAWRMPTAAEFEELMEGCSWTWTARSGRKGYLVTAGNGNSVFFPAGGYAKGDVLHSGNAAGYYWTSDRDGEYAVRLRIDAADTKARLGSDDISLRMSVRPVCN